MFDLNGFVKEMMQTTDEKDPMELAYVVFGKLAPEDREEALLQALRPFIRELIVNDRFVRRDSETREPVAVSAPAAVARPKGRVAGPSRMVQKIRETYNPKLMKSFAGVPTTQYPTGHKPLGAFTVEDVVYVADRDRKNGENLIEWSDRLRKMEQALKEYGVSTLQELPASVTKDL